MTNQEVFNKVAIHLLTQNKKSIVDGGTCLYRAPDGLKCAAGVMIPDELYSPTFEGLTIADIALECTGAASKLMEYFRKEEISIALLRELQTIHDILAVKDWAYRLTALAKKWKLDARVVHEHEKKALHGA